MNFVICSSILFSGSFKNTAWNDSFKWSMIGLLWLDLISLFCFVLPAKWLFCKTSWYLVLAKIFWIPTLRRKSSQSQNIVMLGNLNQNIRNRKLKHLRQTIGNSAIKKKILSRMWRTVAFPCGQGIFFSLFFSFFVSSSWVCVAPWSTRWAFASNVKSRALSGFQVSSISSGGMNSVSQSFINSSISSSLSLCTVSNNVNTSFEYLVR